MKSYLKGIGPLEQLDAEVEVRLSGAVQCLARWERARKELRSDLGRVPNVHEWATAVEHAGEADWCGQVDVEELHATVQRHKRFSDAGLTRPPEAEESLPLVEPSEVCARSFSRQLELMRQAREVMITHNLKLVVAVAKGYADRGVNMQDLIQEGTFGLIRAVEKFDPGHGCRFVTYAHYWVNLSVQRAVQSSSRLIRLPIHMGTALSKVKRTRSAFYNACGRFPTTAELAEASQVPQPKLELLLQSDRDPISLDKQRLTASSDDRPWCEMIADGKETSPESHVEGHFATRAIEHSISSLQPSETQIVSLLYPTDAGGVRRRTREVADTLGFSTAKVRRIEKRALKKLRAKRTLKDLYAQVSHS